MDFPINIRVPAGTTCTGEVAGVQNVCLMKIANCKLLALLPSLHGTDSVQQTTLAPSVVSLLSRWRVPRRVTPPRQPLPPLLPARLPPQELLELPRLELRAPQPPPRPRAARPAPPSASSHRRSSLPPLLLLPHNHLFPSSYLFTERGWARLSPIALYIPLRLSPGETKNSPFLSWRSWPTLESV